MPPCKGHKKSRHGCLMCKRRRVKCDETRPECMNCSGHGVPLKCVYANVKVNWETKSPPTTPPLIPDEQAIVPAQPPLCNVCGYFHRQAVLPPHKEFPGTLPGCTLVKLVSSILNTEDHLSAGSSGQLLCIRSGLVNGIHYGGNIEPNGYLNPSSDNLFLLNHFITMTSHTLALSSHPDSTHLWSQVIPTLTKAHPFLFHAVLAITSAHISHSLIGVDDRKAHEFRHMGEWNFAEALNCLKANLIKGIDELNCHAGFAGNIICLLYVVHHACKRRHIGMGGTTPTQRSLDLTWVAFVRGTYGSALGTWFCIRHGPVSTLINEYSQLLPRTMTRQLSKNTESMLGQLTQLCINFNILGSQAADEMIDVPIATAYYATIYNLRMVWSFLEPCCATTATVSENGGYQNYAPVASAIIQSILRIPPKFWDRLVAKSPRALIIYAYMVVCWEALAYGLVDSNIDDVSSGVDSSLRRNGVGVWWAKGKAENDLKAIEEQLYSMADNDYERETWKEWIVGAWRVFYGLKNGRWISTERANKGYDAPKDIRNELNADPLEDWDFICGKCAWPGMPHT